MVCTLTKSLASPGFRFSVSGLPAGLPEDACIFLAMALGAPARALSNPPKVSALLGNVGDT